jgi:hypothetical protein
VLTDIITQQPILLQFRTSTGLRADGAGYGVMAVNSGRIWAKAGGKHGNATTPKTVSFVRA